MKTAYITAMELLDRNLPDLIIERSVVETMLKARHTRRIQIINGLKPQLLRRALNGEHVGTVIDAETRSDESPNASSRGNGVRTVRNSRSSTTGRKSNGR
jgi:hypothetical protein